MKRWKTEYGYDIAIENIETDDIKEYVRELERLPECDLGALGMDDFRNPLNLLAREAERTKQDAIDSFKEILKSRGELPIT